jgi:hypothetical protein
MLISDGGSLMRLAVAIVAGLILVSSEKDLFGQNAPNAVQAPIDFHGALGGAVSGGGDTDPVRGLYARTGIGIYVASQWRLNVDGAWFVRPNIGDCVNVAAAACPPSGPTLIAALLVGGAHSIPTPGIGDRQVTLSAGLGSGYVRPARGIAAEVSGQVDLVHLGGGAITIDVRGMLLPNVRAYAYWLVPVTMGVRF